MPNPVSRQAMSEPVWNATTIVSTVVLTGGFDAVETTGFYVIFSNTGANNVWIGPDNVSQGLQVGPGESFETAISPGSPLYIVGTVAQTVAVIEYKDA